MYYAVQGGPNKLDLIILARELHKKGITLYVIGCEPDINPYKEWYSGLAHITGGHYIPLGAAEDLAQVFLKLQCNCMPIDALAETLYVFVEGNNRWYQSRKIS